MRERLAGIEELVLLAAASLGDDAYGVTVQQRLAHETGGPVSLGPVYAALDRLERRGHVRSAWGAATPQPGRRRQRVFPLPAPGRPALRDTSATRPRVSPAGRAP